MGKFGLVPGPAGVTVPRVPRLSPDQGAALEVRRQWPRKPRMLRDSQAGRRKIKRRGDQTPAIGSALATPPSGSVSPFPPAEGVGPPVTASSGSVNVERPRDPQRLTSKPPPAPVAPLPVPQLG